MSKDKDTTKYKFKLFLIIVWSIFMLAICVWSIFGLQDNDSNNYYSTSRYSYEELEELDQLFNTSHHIPSLITPSLDFSVFDSSSKEHTTVVVYVTDTGSKYHTANCGYLYKSKYAITLSNAVKKGYTRCSKCNPPRISK